MLLETKNIKENDIIIYSRNSMDENYNFRIVFKNDPETYRRIISFDHVKKLITEFFPKNLIAYRILCNFPDITISNIKYGCVILANSEPELIFTDPVFAVQTIEEYILYNRNIEFRFRIQQVGYTTLDRVEGKANFQEEFVFDLKMDEAINQNDEIFVVPLLEKQIASRIRKKSVREIKRDIIFKPENQSKLEFIEKTVQPKTKKRVVAQELAKRNERVGEGEMIYAGNSLILGKIERLQVDKKQIEFPFLNKRRISEDDYQILESSRNFQQKLRKPLNEVGSLNINNPNELRAKSSDSENDKDVEFKKIQSSASVNISKAVINEDGSQSPVDIEKTKNHKDDLFSNFLNNLQSESKSKIKKKKKRYKESDIIQMFKSIRTSKTGDGDDKKNTTI